jgi:signal transduction histidine kinase/DNA-binding NarL/FixJ family response regulator
VAEGARGRGAAGAAAVYLPAAVALLCILLAGLFVERQREALAEASLRNEVRGQAETVAARLGEEAAAVERLAGALSFAADPGPAALEAAAPRVPEGTTLVALPAEGAPFAHPEGHVARVALQLLASPAVPGEGVRLVDDTAGARLLIWTTLPDGGRVAAAVSAAELAATEGLDVALAGPGAGAGGGPGALRLAGPDGTTPAPVEVPVALPGGDWALQAAPAGGWDAAGHRRWPLGMAILAVAGLIVGPMVRTRTLVEERQRTIGALHDREAELVQLSRRLGLALDASKVGVWDFNLDTGVLIWDERMDELYGYPPGARSHDYADWRDRLHPDDLARAEAEFRQAIELGGRYVSDYRLVLPDGGLRHIRAIGAVYRGSDGPSQIVGVNWDVTADVRRNEELVARRLEAEGASLAKSQFLATICHEIRTPMNGLIGMLDLMLRAGLDAAQRERAAIARESAEQLLAILNDVLDLSKLEADRVAIDRAPADLHRMARDVAALMATVARGRDLAVTVRIAPEVPKVLLCDAKRVRQVLMNLVGNAVKFTEKGRIEVTLDYLPQEERLEVAVRDTGIGISEAAKRRLFERYSQVHGAAADCGGTGLGLAIARQLVELMGGGIGVESVEGLGSTFSFWLPAAPAAPGEEEAAAEPSLPLPALPPARILVAEDNPTNRQILEAYLAMGGHSARMVEDGAEACAAVGEEDFDLIVMDVQMPVMDGVTATRWIRELDGAKAGIPIVALTANAMQGDRDRFIAAGMNDYVSKPVALDDLYRAIARCLEDYSAPDAGTGSQPSPGSKVSIAAARSRVSSPRSFS